MEAELLPKLEPKVLNVPVNTVAHTEQGYFRVVENDGVKEMVQVAAIKSENGVIEYTNDVYQSSSKQKLIYRDGNFFVQNQMADNGEYMTCLKSGQLVSEEMVPVSLGEEIVMRNGQVLSVKSNDDGTFTLVESQNGVSGEQKEFMKKTIESIDSEELTQYLKGKFEELGRSGLFNVLSKNEDGLLNMQYFFDKSDLVLWMMRFNNNGFKSSDGMVGNFLAEFLKENNPEGFGILEAAAKSRFFDKARRLDFEAKRYEFYKKKGALPDELENLPESAKKAADMWNKLLQAGSEEEQGGVLSENLDKLSPEVRKKIVSICQKFKERKYDDPELVPELKKYSELVYKTSVMPLDSKVFNQYLMAQMIEAEYTKEAFPFVGDCVLESQKKVDLFWNSYFEAGEGEKPEWFEDISYKKGDVNYFFRANAGSEFHGGNPNSMFLDTEGPESIVPVLNHESTHRLFSFAKCKRGYAQRECEPSTFKHEETVVELLRQCYDSMKIENGRIVFDLPENNVGESSYQRGVNALLEIAREVETKRGQAVGEIVKGIFDYNDGKIGNPLEIIQKSYETKTRKTDFWERMNPHKHGIIGVKREEKVSMKDEDIPEELRQNFKDGVLWM